MCMSGLERRVQLLLDADRYERIAAEAKRTGHSVNAVIRDAIDLSLPSDLMMRNSPLTTFHDLVAQGPGESDDWAVLKERPALDTDARLSR